MFIIIYQEYFYLKKNNIIIYQFLTKVKKELLNITTLLHDVGHVPLSHTVEQAMKRFYDKASTPIYNEFLNNIDNKYLTNNTVNESKYITSDTKLHERLA